MKSLSESITPDGVVRRWRWILACLLVATHLASSSRASSPTLVSEGTLLKYDEPDVQKDQESVPQVRASGIRNGPGAVHVNRSGVPSSPHIEESVPQVRASGVRHEAGTVQDSRSDASFSPSMDEEIGEACDSEYCPTPWNGRSAWHDRLWVRSECLLWWTEGIGLPPLVTTSPVGTLEDTAGVLDQPGTRILFGNEGAASGVHPGGRISFGYWLTPCQTAGIEASYLGVGGGSTRFRASSDTTPIIARPVFDTPTSQQAAMLIAYPDLIRGSLGVEASTELQSAELLWRRSLHASPHARLDFVGGYRFGRLDDNVHVDQFSEWVAAQGQIIPGTTLQLFDDFNTQNQFHGGELGLVYQRQLRRCSWEVLMKLALGNTHSLVQINGATHIAVPNGGETDFVGGLLAQETNIGRYEQNGFSVLPELGTTLGWNLTSKLRATVGYTFFYWANVMRPAEQIDVGVSQFPPESPAGERRPEFKYSRSDFWAQGLNLGFDYRF